MPSILTIMPQMIIPDTIILTDTTTRMVIRMVTRMVTIPMRRIPDTITPTGCSLA